MAKTAIASLARIGGLSRAARYDGVRVTQAARDTFRDSFLTGHDCKVCPRIDVPADLPLPERERRAAVLHRLHYERIARVAAQRRREHNTKAARSGFPEAKSAGVSDATAGAREADHGDLDDAA